MGFIQTEGVRMPEDCIFLDHCTPAALNLPGHRWCQMSHQELRLLRLNRDRTPNEHYQLATVTTKMHLVAMQELQQSPQTKLAPV